MGLQPVAQLDSYKGLLFATFDPEAPPLREYLGRWPSDWMCFSIAARVASKSSAVCTNGSSPAIGSSPPKTSPATATTCRGATFRRSEAASCFGANTRPEAAGRIVAPGNGHAIVCVGPNDMTEPPMPEILAYEQEIRPEVEKRLGPRMALVSPVVGTLFPNFSLLRVGSRTFRVWHPRGTDKTEVWSWVYVDRAAPPQVKEAIRLAGMRGFGPSGTVEQDDMDNWQECTRACRGAVSRRAFLNTQMGLGHEGFDPDLNAWASDFRMSESNHRQFYRR